MTDAVRERYARFAREEAPGRSEEYREWAAGVASDADVSAVLARIPETHRQPPLVFAVTRMLGADPSGYATWRAFVLAHDDDIVAECTARRVQTNEPLRLSPLLPALSEIPGPLALLEIGASAGLCLYPDRYSFRFWAEDGSLRAALDPEAGISSVVLDSVVRGELPPMRIPEVVWRAGIDLAPLDARDERDRRWLRGLVWPGEAGREERITAALDVAASEPPQLVEGDALRMLSTLAGHAPDAATLVITTPGVLVHIPRAERLALVEEIRRLPARWVTIDPPGILDIWSPHVNAGAAQGFVVALDGRVRARADPLGRWWEWRTEDRPGAL
ncbi:DUF2332 domain-containing protein [Microbacterium sp.]|uniref:DUF2332 domain-containing protein n=1 Tax=Microbacterium sp. TaxID=51671 RepID=UPI0028116B22|nr:DUF2332 domain-containing protein [Microbacterium sp.]